MTDKQPETPHCRVGPEEDELDDKVCSCAPEPYMVEWLEAQEKAEEQENAEEPGGKQKEPGAGTPGSSGS